MRCKNCGAENAQGNLFCEECGMAFEKCPVCGKTHEIKEFCPVKGDNIKKFLAEKEEREVLAKKKEATINLFKQFTKRWQPLLWIISVLVTEIVIAILILSVIGIIVVTDGKLSGENIEAILYAQSLLGLLPITKVVIEDVVSRNHFKKKFAEKFPEEARYLD